MHLAYWQHLPFLFFSFAGQGASRQESRRRQSENFTGTLSAQNPGNLNKKNVLKNFNCTKSLCNKRCCRALFFFFHRDFFFILRFIIWNGSLTTHLLVVVSRLLLRQVLALHLVEVRRPHGFHPDVSLQASCSGCSPCTAGGDAIARPPPHPLQKEFK